MIYVMIHTMVHVMIHVMIHTMVHVMIHTWSIRYTGRSKRSAIYRCYYTQYVL